PILPLHFSSQSSVHPPALHSFPTRRSSDLAPGRPLRRLSPLPQPVACTDEVFEEPEDREGPAALGPPAGKLRQVVHDPGRLQRRSEEHTSELQSRFDLVCRLLLEKKN